jgi:NAD+-dependent secondary alcohol dehydrogenase Adh1
MRAARVHGYTDHKLHLDEVPEPTIVSPFDVIIRIGGAGVCRTDLHILEGQWDFTSPGLPFIVGHENAGWVHEIGSAVTSVQVGDTVIAHSFVTCGLCRPCRRGDDVHCENSVSPGISADGGFAELMRTRERSLLKVDPSLHPREIAGLTDAGLTAYHAVRRAAALLEPGHKVVAIGAGGLGLIGVQLLRALTPAEVIVVEPREASRALAAEVGAHHTVAADGTQVQQVLDITDGRGAEVVLDFVGEFGTPADGVAMTRRAGSYFVVGYGGSLEISTLEIIAKELTIVGNAAGSYDDLADLATLTAQGGVTLHTTSYPLEAVNDALNDLEQGRIQGRAVLVPA